MSIEQVYKQFSDVHPNIILKTAVLRDGMQISQEAQQQFLQMEDVEWKGMHLFSYDRQKTVVYGERVPKVVYLEPDRVPIQVRTNIYSPYALDFRDGQFVFTESGEVIGGPLSFSRKPKWYDAVLDDGTSCRLVEGICDELLFVTLNKYCELWNTGDECLFCNINVTFKDQRKGGEDVVGRMEPRQIADAVKVAMELDPCRRMIEITGGTILGKYRGEEQLEFYCRRLEAIRDRIQTWLSSMFQVHALDDEGWKRLYKTGVQTIQPNMEVWDKRLFKWINPGKDKFVGHDYWVKQTIRAVDFWGVGRVNPNFVLGVEMAKPHGFEKVSDAVKSTAGGWDFLMSHGVLPRYNQWMIEAGSPLGDQEPPPMEYYIEVEKAYVELRQKHGFDPPYPGALTRSSYFIACLQDYEYYHGSGIPSKQWQEQALKRERGKERASQVSADSRQ